MSNVKLAIRVRPFTDRELANEKDRVPVVSVINEKTVAITNVKVSASGAGDSRERVRRYYADYTFDSACPPDDPAYASQEKVFETIGREVSSSVSRGHSACVLAYGQSATGKTHTMIGSDTEPGLVPRLCHALTTDQGLDITASFLEIYNERVHDLLAGESPPACQSLPRQSLSCQSLPRRRGNTRKDLRVREHPERGPYVQNLRRVAVHDVQSLLSLVTEGVRRRRTAATRRNSSSSRSHALLELATPTATLHLADLAGSEKASWEGFAGGSGRQKEGANINKSLVALSNVISALISGGHRGRFVPYRDSALTWLLKDCFTGGASTFIIATVSPSVCCYGESASTLRWAARARQLPSARPPCAGPSAASRAALHAQLHQLIAELARHYIRYIPETGKLSYDDDHWSLNTNAGFSHELDSELKKRNIGDVMNLLNPKEELHHSQSPSATSSNSDVIDTKRKIIKEQSNKQVDNIFGPALERTKSGTDLKTIKTFRHQKRQYKSQEILPINKSLQIYDPETSKTSPSQSSEQLNDTESSGAKTNVTIQYDSQRAEIVESVTERLYSKLKKKEETAVNKMESIVDRKIMEPLSELRICTNARQRLMELSQKAMRNKRRIGIPAHTQTRIRAIRVKDQGIDAQTDLETYFTKKNSSVIIHKDVATETESMTPRCKEIAVGPVGSLDFCDRSTLTETKQILKKNTLMMTDVIEKYDSFSQTPIAPPRRRRKRPSDLFKRTNSDNKNEFTSSTEDITISPVISINISQHYTGNIQSSDDSHSDKTINDKHTNATITPDLLTNHNTGESNVSDDFNSPNDVKTVRPVNTSVRHAEFVKEEIPKEDAIDFPESEDHLLPRVTIVSTKTATEDDLKDIILGRNNLVHPCNIFLSPQKEREGIKRTVKFRDCEAPAIVGGLRSTRCRSCSSDLGIAANPGLKGFESAFNKNDCRDSEATVSDSDSSKAESDCSFVWKKVVDSDGKKASSWKYAPVYKSDTKYNSAKAKIYREFLGFDNKELNTEQYLKNYSSLNDVSDTCETESQHSFKERQQFFEDKFKYRDFATKRFYNFSTIERNLLDSCNSLDAAVNKYGSYLADYHGTGGSGNVGVANKAQTRTPTEYLQHLVQVRRDLINASDSMDSSNGLSYNY